MFDQSTVQQYFGQAEHWWSVFGWTIAFILAQ